MIGQQLESQQGPARCAELCWLPATRFVAPPADDV